MPRPTRARAVRSARAGRRRHDADHGCPRYATRRSVSGRRPPRSCPFGVHPLPERSGSRPEPIVSLTREHYQRVLDDLAIVVQVDQEQAEILSTLGSRVGSRDEPGARDPAGLSAHAAARPRPAAGRREFAWSPGTDELRQLDAGLVLTSITTAAADSRPAVRRAGRASCPTMVDGLTRTGEPVRRIRRGLISAGPLGLSARTSPASMQTVQALVADFNDGRLTDPWLHRRRWIRGPPALPRLCGMGPSTRPSGSADGRVRNKVHRRRRCRGSNQRALRTASAARAGPGCVTWGSRSC